MSDAWELELELLSLLGEGQASVKRLRNLCSAIAKACDGVPDHVREIARIADTTHRERDLHRWVRRQPWSALFPSPFTFKVPEEREGVRSDDGEISCLLPHEQFSTLSDHDELFEEMITGEPGKLNEFWTET